MAKTKTPERRNTHNQKHTKTLQPQKLNHTKRSKKIPRTQIEEWTETKVGKI